MHSWGRKRKSLWRSVKLLGGNPEKRFLLEDLKNKLKRCGKFFLRTAQKIMQVPPADSSEVSNMNKILDNVAEIGREILKR